MGEAHRRINDYLNRFSDAVSTQDGASLKQLLSLSSNNPAILSLADALNVFVVMHLHECVFIYVFVSIGILGF